MKKVSLGRSADESRPLSCARRPGLGLRKALAGTFLAAMMLGCPAVMAGRGAVAAPTAIAILNANQTSERITADPGPGAPTGLTAKAGNAQVILTWATPTSDGGPSIIDPGAPTGLAARAGDAQVTLTWAAPAPNGGPQVTGYNVYDGTTADFKASTMVQSSASTSATATGLSNGTTYYFWVTAVNTVGQGPASNDASATPAASVLTTVPGAPTGLAARAGDAQVTLTWAAPAPNGGPQVTGYNVYDGTTADFKASTMVQSSASTSATATGLSNGTTYYFWVTAVNTVGQGPASNDASATPAASVLTTVPGAPTGLAARAGDAQVTLTWAAPAPNGGPQVTGYNVYDGTTADFKASTMVQSSASTSATATGLSNGTTYYFWVTAVNTVGQGPASNDASATPAASVLTTVPGAPTGLAARAGDAQAILSGAASTSDGGASITGYNIYEGTSPGAESSTPVPRSDITGCTSTASTGSCTVTALVNGTAYYFRVAAVNDLNAVGLMSNEASATPAASVLTTVPGAPTGLAARAGDAQVTLTWAAPAPNGGPQITGYNVYDGTTADFKASTPVTSSASTSVTVTGLANGTTYYFRVTAVKAAGHESPSSAEVSARPEAAAKVKLTSGSVPKELIAALATIATMAVAGALTLAMRGRRPNSSSPRHVTPASDVRAVPGFRPPDAVNVRETGREPTHTVRFEPDRGTTTTTIKEKP